MIESEIERMLNNWALWSAGGGLAAHCAVSVYDLGGRGTRAASTMPVIDGEAMDIDAIIKTLEFEERQALHARYKREVLVEPMLKRRVREVRLRNPRIPGSFTDEQVARLLRTSNSTYKRRWQSARREVARRYADLRRRP